MTVKDVLLRAYRLIERPECWIKGYGAKDTTGIWVGTHEPTAVCWCMTGALSRAARKGPFPNGLLFEKSVLLVARAINFDNPPTGIYNCKDAVMAWNDNPKRTHTEVLNVLKDAMQIAHEENL